LIRSLATTLAAIVFISACSSDPVEQYLDRVTDITATMRTDSIAALPNPSTPTRDGVANVNAARQRAIVDLEQLAPPTEVRPEHAALILAISNLVTAGEDFLTTAQGLTDGEFAQAVRSATGIDEAARRVASACDAMQGRATELGYVAGIRC
jgi:hypothetical protein